MEFIAHRVNTINELNQLPQNFGVELDLRDGLDGKIYIAHDPFINGDDFEEYLKNYKHETMILNIKSERIEFKCLKLLKQYDVKKYFFLDSSFPMIIALINSGEKNIALRLSEYEGMDTIRNMSGKAKWVWVDCFTKIPLDFNIYQELKSMGYKLCLVSPELQGRDEYLEKYKKTLANENIIFDAICTKSYNIKRWE